MNVSVAPRTALEHDMYMRLINCWAERSGFGTFVIRREDAGDGEPPTVRAAKDVKGELMVLKPEMIVGLLLEMATGDENMPKGGHPEDLARLAATDDKNLAGPRAGWTRKKGDFGYGAYGDEPWSLQAMEKRIYAMRDFYARELKGTTLEDPATDPLVRGTRSRQGALGGRHREARQILVLYVLAYQEGKGVKRKLPSLRYSQQAAPGE